MNEIINMVDALFGCTADLSGETLTPEQMMNNDQQFQQFLDQQEQEWSDLQENDNG